MKGKGGKGGGRRAAAKRSARKAKKYNSGDFARVQHVLQNELAVNATGNGSAGSPSQVYQLYNFALSNSPRATAVAQGFQEYRISKVELFIKAVADTFDSGLIGTGNNPSVPHFLYMIDKTATLMNNGSTSQTLKQAGAKPIRLDDKTIYIKFKPAVQIGSSEVIPGPAPVGELSAAYKTSPWLTTNGNAGTAGSPWVVNSVDHMGISFAAEQPRGPTPTQVASVSIRITYEFRKPLWFVEPPAPGNEPLAVNMDAPDYGLTA